MRNATFERLKNVLQDALLVFLFWVSLSIFASAIKLEQEVCGKEYPIGYLLHTNLFCEIEEKAP